jgi:iron complex outermembrane receptor protein
MAAFVFVSRARSGLRAAVVVSVLGVAASLFAGAASAQPQVDEPSDRASEQAAEGAPSGETAAPEAAPEESPTPSEASPAAKSEPSLEGVEEIMVIGEVLETSTQAEAEAITTFDQAELDTLGISDVDSLALNTPSLHVGQVGQQAVITLRGVGLENLTSIGEAGVGFQVDGVHLARPAAANAGFFDLERVDVIRGPVGTRGGRQTNGGRIGLWSAKPSEDFEASGDASYGNYNAIETRTVLNVPIWDDKLMTRLSTLFSNRRGYQDNDMYSVDNKDTGDGNDLAGRLQARSLLFDQQVELRAIGTHGYQRGRGPDLKLLGRTQKEIDDCIASGGLNCVAGPPSTLINTIRTYSQQWPQRFPGETFANSFFSPENCPPQTDPLSPSEVCLKRDPRDGFLDFVSDRDNEQSGLIGTGTWDLPFFQDTPLSDLRIGFIGSWQENIEDFKYDFDGTNIPEQLLDLKRNSKQNSAEVYIERLDVGRWDFRSGFYWLDETVNSDVCFDIGGVQTSFDFDYDGEIGTESYAGYGEAAVRVLENLRAYGGVRWTRDQKANREQFFRVNPVAEITSPDNQPDVCGAYTRSILNRGQRLLPRGFADHTEEYEGWTPAVGFDWQVTDASSIGASITRGFKAGGFPTVVNPDLSIGLDKPYDSEFTWEYELTSKNEFFDGRLRLNGTLFWVEYDPFQVCQFNGPSYFCNSNGSATIRGLELEWVATPIEGLQINGHFNWLDSRINNFQIIDPTARFCPQGPPCPDDLDPPSPQQTILATDVSGNSLSRSPAWAGSIGIQYELDFGRWGFFTPRFQTQYQDTTYYRVFNTEFDSQDPFIKYDAKIMWRSEDDRFKAEVFGVNLSDEDVINSVIVGSTFSGGQAFAQYQAPRTYGVKFGINYVSDWVADIADRVF